MQAAGSAAAPSWRWAPLGLIGVLALAAQPSSGQSPTQGRPWIEPSDRRFQDHFRVLLLDEPTRDLARGWSYAAELGRPVAPLLWKLHDSERSNLERRLALLVAALVAGGPAADERMLRLLDQQKPLLAERAMTSLWIALGPARPKPVPEIVQRLVGPNKEPEALLAIAARLAAARFPASRQPPPALHARDPGVLAAAAFAQLPVGRTSAARQWRGGLRHSDLFRRAAMLGALRIEAPASPPAEVLARASATVVSPDARDRGERAAAALLLARFGRFCPEQPPLGWELLKLAASQPESAPALRARLRPARFARDPEPGRLAAAYALYAPISEVLKRADEWSQDVVVRRHLAIALAARLTAIAAPPAIDMRLGFPEWSLVVWASGGTVEQVQRFEDPRLASLGEVMAAGRVTKASVRRELELVLWRWGSHPSLGPLELERELVRDLLLVGSRAGGKYAAQVPSHLRYFPTGLDRDDPFFDIAVALFEFASRRVGPVPAAYRLR